MAGLFLALAMGGCQSDTAADEAPTALASVQSASGGGAGSGWRAIPAIGWALGEWEDALDRFGDLVELLPQPADFLCEHASDHDVLTRLRCEYWDRLKGHLDGDDRSEEDDEDDEGDEDERDEGRGSRGSRDATSDEGDNDDPSWSDGDDTSGEPSGLGG
ncbi:MAG: hypothetical protein ABW252_24050 [Polyangiales bacterium]